MTRRLHASGAATLALLLTAVPLFAQSQSADTKAVLTQLATPVKGFTPPKTEWGDPDISGVWTSDAALGIPRERPEKFGTRAMLNDEEFAAAKKADTDRRVGAENATGAFRNDGAWKTKSYRQTSLVIEPENGRTPAFTAEAQKRAATRDRGSFGEGPFDSPLDFTLYDRCITRGIVGSIMPVVYGNGNRIVQSPGQVVISYEMVHDTRVIYTDGRPHPAPGGWVPTGAGHSIGRYEGNVLVVESVGMTPGGVVGGGQRTAETKLTERFEVAPDGQSMTITYSWEDAKIFQKPHVYKYSFDRLPPGSYAFEDWCDASDPIEKYSVTPPIQK